MRHETRWRRHAGAAVLAATLLGVPAATTTAADLESLERRAEELIERLDAELEAVRVERAALRREREALRAERRALGAEAPEAEAAASAETERRVDVLAEELEALRSRVVLPPTAEYKSVYGMGPAASKVYQVARGLSIGGYGEGFLNEVVSDTKGSSDRADALRFVLYTGYKFSDRILLNSEIEFEHGTTSSTASSSGGSVSVEQAYLDFLGWESLNARAGLILVPLGFVNELHEPTTFHGNNRPVVERTIIPTTWRELGAGLFGQPHPDLQYRAYVHTSLDAMGFSESGIRGGRQSGNRALAESIAASARVDYSPARVPGLLVGVSGFAGETGQNQTFDGGDVDATLLLGDVHAQYRRGGLELRGLLAGGTLDDAGAIGRQVERSIGERFQGHYVEVAYDVWSALGPEGSQQYVAPFFRYESLDPQEGTPVGVPRDRAQDMEVYTVGVSYRPHPQVALKLDYRNFAVARGERPDDVNVGLGFVF